jgi:excisionase family DNA binding protein
MEILTAAEAAALLHVHPKTLDRWVAEGRLPVIQTVPRGKRQFLRSDVEALLVPFEWAQE